MEWPAAARGCMCEDVSWFWGQKGGVGRYKGGGGGGKSHLGRGRQRKCRSAIARAPGPRLQAARGLSSLCACRRAIMISVLDFTGELEDA